MNRPTVIPVHIWEGLSGEAHAVIGSVIVGLEQQIAELKQQVQELKARLDQNSTNSSRPPSTDPIGIKRKPPTPPSKKRRGGQKGHPRRMRELVPPERVTSVTECKPAECRRCGHALSGEDAEPRRHQVAELPPIEPEVHEYRLHRLCCPHCETVTCGALPDGVPRTSFGPRLHAALSVLTGAYRLSKRQVVQLGSDLLGLTISVGMIAKLERITADVLEQPVTELAEAVKAAEAANIDETGWREARLKAWLWVVVTSVGVVFRIARSRAGAVAADLLGEEPKPIVISDRFPGYEWIKLEVEASLLGSSPPRFAGDDRPRWRRRGSRTPAALAIEQAVRVLAQGPRRHHPTIDLPPDRGVVAADGPFEPGARVAVRLRQDGDDLRRVAAPVGLPVDLHARFEGVEPTNNAAERALRHAVIWRRISGGTDSEAGSRFVERMLSVVATCRQQKRGVLEYLTRCHRARLLGKEVPSLIDTHGSLTALAG